MIPCLNCGREARSEASRCPNCAYPMKLTQEGFENRADCRGCGHGLQVLYPDNGKKHWHKLAHCPKCGVPNPVIDVRVPLYGDTLFIAWAASIFLFVAAIFLFLTA